MRPSDYVRESGATDLRDYSQIIERLSKPETARMMHYLVGLCTETGELQDQFKKHVMYGKELDRVNIIEESGDLIWYLSRLLELVGSSFEEIMEKNNAKLKARYGDKFTEFAALNRNLEAERKILEEEAG